MSKYQKPASKEKGSVGGMRYISKVLPQAIALTLAGKRETYMTERKISLAGASDQSMAMGCG